MGDDTQFRLDAGQLPLEAQAALDKTLFGKNGRDRAAMVQITEKLVHAC